MGAGPTLRRVTFGRYEEVWASLFGNLRNTGRQHVIASQLSQHLLRVHDVLDVGCGQGTQALLLASRGLQVVGVDPSGQLLQRLRDAAAAGV